MKAWRAALRHRDAGRDAFATLVRERLVAAGERRPIRYDRPEFALRIGTQDGHDQQTVWLDNLFASFARLSAAEQPAALSRVVASIVESGVPAPQSFAEAVDRLLPLVRSMADIGMSQLRGRLDGRASDVDIPHRRLAPQLAAWLVLDGDETIMWILSSQLTAWGVTFDDAFAAALANLRRRGEKPLLAVAPGLYRSDWADRYDASRLLLPELFTALPLKGAPVAMAPNRDVLLVTGADDEDGLRAMARFGRSVLDGPRPLSAAMLTLDGDAWREFLPDPSQPGQTGLAELQEVLAGIDYAGQKALLDAIHVKAGEDIYVATHSVRRERKTGRFAGSFTTWTKGVDSLLPKAESLVFVELESRRMTTISWEKAAPIVGDLLAPVALLPERFRARRYPDEAQLERLRAAAEDVAYLPPEGSADASLSTGQNFDASAYPKSYRIAPRWRTRWIILSAILIAAGLGGIGYAAIAAIQTYVAIIVAVVSLNFMLLAAYAISSILKWRVTLFADAIQASGFLRTRQLQRDEIKGYRLSDPTRNGLTMTVVPVEDDRKSRSSPPLEMDAAFAAWFSGLPDLNADDMRTSQVEIAANTAFGRTPEDRLRRLAQAHKIAKVLDFAIVAVLLWCFIAPRPYAPLIAVLVAIPLLALLLVVLSRGLFRIDARRNDLHANLGTVFFLPGFALMARALLDLDMVSWLPAMAAGGIAGGLLIGSGVTADRNLQRRPWTVLGCVVLAGTYGFGATVEANALLDRSRPAAFRSAVIGKHVSYGKATRYLVQVAPWGPRSEAGDVSVPRTFYDIVQPGTSVCIHLRQGALGMPWFIVLGCR